MRMLATKDVRFIALVAIAAAVVCDPLSGYAQEHLPPALKVGVLPDDIAIDGVLNEPAWDMAARADAFTQTDPAEGAAPAGRTDVRVLAGRKRSRSASSARILTRPALSVQVEAGERRRFQSTGSFDRAWTSLGVSTRLRWTFRPVADLFVVYNHDVRNILDRWQPDSNQLLVKLQYAWRL